MGKKIKYTEYKKKLKHDSIYVAVAIMFLVLLYIVYCKCTHTQIETGALGAPTVLLLFWIYYRIHE